MTLYKIPGIELKPFPAWGLLIPLLMITAWLYWPGLSGPFLLDDDMNLNRLEEIKQGNGYLGFIFEGITGSLGRPLALLTFALQAEQWPDPWAFKYINLLIHLINGCLVFFLSQMILRLAALPQNRIPLLATLITAVWLLHPIQVSTILYVIQRMTQLAATMVLLGVIFYLHGRIKVGTSPARAPYLWITLGAGLCLGLAVLSKENGILLPAFILLVEYLFFAGQDKPRPLVICQALLLYLPLLLFIIYLGMHLDHFAASYQFRDFSMPERLLSQAHVLMDYLSKIVLPRPSQFSLYYDDFPVSRGLLSPPATLISLTAIVLLLALAFFYRRRRPLISFAILWFFIGHTLEAGIIPLELYFEHRNYLPLLGPAVAVALLANLLYDKAETRLGKRFMFVSPLFIILLLSLNTGHQMGIWGHPIKLSLIWAEEKPHSNRAQADAAQTMTRLGRYGEARGYYQRILANDPDDPAPYISWLQLGCFDDQVSLPPRAPLMATAQQGKLSLAAIAQLNVIVLIRDEGGCQRLEYDYLHDILTALYDNTNFIVRQAELLHVLAMLEASGRHYLQAVETGQRSLARKQNIRLAMQQLFWLSQAGQYKSAADYLQHIKTTQAGGWKNRLIWQKELADWETFLNKQLSRSAAGETTE